MDASPAERFSQGILEEKGIDITYRQAREPMGLLKIDHIKAILSMPEVNEKFRALYKRDWNKGTWMRCTLVSRNICSLP